MKMEVDPSNQRILWKCTGLLYKQLKVDFKCIQKGVLPNPNAEEEKTDSQY